MTRSQRVSKLYRNALSLLDSSSQERVRLFYHRADSCRMYCWPLYHIFPALTRGVRALFRCPVSSLPGCLIGRLLPRVLLSEKGISAENIKVAKTDTGKPYFARRLSVLTLAPSPTLVLLPTGHVGRRTTHRV